MDVGGTIKFLAAYPLWIKITISLCVVCIVFLLLFFAPKPNNADFGKNDNNNDGNSYINMKNSTNSALLHAGRDINITNTPDRAVPRDKLVDTKKDELDGIRQSETSSKSTSQKDHAGPNLLPPVSVPATTAERGSAIPSSSQVPQQQKRSVGIKIEGSTGVTMEGNYFEGLDTAIEADNSSDITARGNVINRNTPNQTFPPPTGELSSLTNTALRDLTKNIVSEMRVYEASHDQRVSELFLTDHDFSRRDEQMKKLQAEKTAGFNTKYSGKSISLASEMLHRVGRVEVSPTDSPSIRMGAVVVQRGMLVGPHPMAAAGDFLNYLAVRLPK